MLIYRGILDASHGRYDVPAFRQHLSNVLSSLIRSSVVAHRKFVVQRSDREGVTELGSALVFVVGGVLREIFEKYFKAKMGTARPSDVNSSNRPPNSPFIRFAEAALREVRLKGPRRKGERRRIERSILARR